MTGVRKLGRELLHVKERKKHNILRLIRLRVIDAQLISREHCSANNQKISLKATSKKLLLTKFLVAA